MSPLAGVCAFYGAGGACGNGGSDGVGSSNSGSGGGGGARVSYERGSGITAPISNGVAAAVAAANAARRVVVAVGLDHTVEGEGKVRTRTRNKRWLCCYLLSIFVHVRILLLRLPSMSFHAFCGIRSL